MLLSYREVNVTGTVFPVRLLQKGNDPLLSHFYADKHGNTFLSEEKKDFESCTGHQV